MRRDDDSLGDGLFALLLIVPAWVGPLLAAASAVLALAMPLLFAAPPSGQVDARALMVPLLRGLGSAAGVYVLLLWAAAEVAKWWGRRRPGRQRGMGSIHHPR